MLLGLGPVRVRVVSLTSVPRAASTGLCAACSVPETARSTWAWRSLRKLLPNSDLFLFRGDIYV